MLRLYCNLFFFILLAPATGQTVGELLRKAERLRLVDMDSSLVYAERAYQQALAAGVDSLIVDAMFMKGWALHSAGEPFAAANVFRSLIALESVAENDAGYIRAHGRLGNIFTDLGMYDSAMVYLLRYDALVDTHLSPTNTEAKLQLGELYRVMGRMDQSDHYKLEAIRRSRVSGRRIDRMMSLYYYLDDNLARIGTVEMQPYLEEYLSLLDDREWDHATRRQHAVMLFDNLSVDERARLLSEAVEQNKATGLTSGLLFLNKELVRAYRESAQNPKALEAAEYGLEAARQRGDVGYMLDYSRLLADLFKEQDDFERALAHRERFSHLLDSVRTIEINRNLDSLNVKFETAKKEAQIADQSLQIQKARNQRNLLLGGLAMAVWLGTFIALYLWNRNRLTKRIAAQEAEMSRQHIAQLEQEKQLLAMHSMIEGQEAERMRIARDLHDGLGGLLSTVKAHFSVIQGAIDELESMNVYSEVDRLIDTASAEVRRISHNMAPHALRFGGLKDAVNDLANQLRSHGLQVNLEWPDEIDLGQNTEIMLYRIIQELANNVVKYANATRILIQMTVIEQEIGLIIEDDGIGFDHSDPHIQKGIGLKSVASRVSYLKGEIDIDSIPQVGTTVAIQLPLSPNRTNLNS